MYVSTKGLDKEQTVDYQADDGVLVLDPPVVRADTELDADADRDGVKAKAADLKKCVCPEKRTEGTETNHDTAKREDESPGHTREETMDHGGAHYPRRRMGGGNKSVRLRAALQLSHQGCVCPRAVVRRCGKLKGSCDGHVTNAVLPSP